MIKTITTIVTAMQEAEVGWDDEASQFLVKHLASHGYGITPDGKIEKVRLARCHIDPDQVCWSAVIRDAKNVSQAQSEAE